MERSESKADKKDRDATYKEVAKSLTMHVALLQRIPRNLSVVKSKCDLRIVNVDLLTAAGQSVLDSSG